MSRVDGGAVRNAAAWLARPRNGYFDTVCLMVVMAALQDGLWLAALTGLLVGSVVSVGLRIYGGLLNLSQEEQP